MVMKKIFIIILVLGVSVAIFVFGPRQYRKRGLVEKQTPTPALSSSDPFLNVTMVDYKNTSKKFVFRVPNTFKAEVKEEDVVFKPVKAGTSFGNVNYISVIKRPLNSGKMTTAKEFNTMETTNPEDDGSTNNLGKIDEVVIDGNKTVVFVTAPADGNGWGLTAWLIKGPDNFYITAQGKQSLSDDDIEVFESLLSNFSFME